MTRKFETGSQLAGYRILGLLGQGGMGLVYEAEHIMLGRKAALKTLVAELVEDAEFRERFIRESQLVAAIDHPNIIPIYDAGEADGTAYIAMRFVDGFDLSDLIAREAPLDLERTISLLDQAAGALDAAHTHDLVHRDVKPANLLVDEPTGRVYLMDFGIAKERRSRGLTKPGFFLGTIEYAAPEQIEGKELGPAADLYAFGCLLYESLSGKPPFERDTDLAIVHAHLLDPPPAISATRPDLPAALDDVIAKAMAKAEGDRYGSCRELIDAVRAAAGTGPAAVQVGALPWEAAPADGGTKRERIVTLPTPATAFIDRERDLDETRAVLGSDARLLTLTGLGGVGKTRLAIAIATALADDYDDVHFVDLSSVTDPSLVGSAIATALGIEDTGDESLRDRLITRLADRNVLLVLDNFEQVLSAGPFVAELLDAAPQSKAIVTSQAALRVAGEHNRAVLPLDLPDPSAAGDPDAVAASPAVALFVSRARAVKPDFEVTRENAAAVAEICTKLDGLPLALELAAARTRLLSPQAMLSRLEKRLDLLTGGTREAPLTQQGLRNAIDWTYQLLEETERELLARLAVFVGGSTIEAAEAVSADDLGLGEVMDALGSLVDKSLLRQDEGADAEPRFQMLETIREYALGQLDERGELERLRRLHAERFVTLAEAAEPELSRPSQVAWLEKLDWESANIRAALAWTVESGEFELALRLAGALVRFWSTRGLMTEGRRWLEAALERSKDVSPPVRAKALFAAGYAALGHGDFDQAEPFFEESLAIARDQADERGEAACLAQLGWVLMARGTPDRAGSLAEESLEIARRIGDKLTASGALNVLADLAARTEEHEAATPLFEESLALRRELGDKRLVANSLLNLGRHELSRDDFDRASELLQEGLALARELGDTWSLSVALGSLARAQVYEGNYEPARALFAEALILARDRGDRRAASECVQGIAASIGSNRDVEVAARLWGAADALLRTTGASPSPAERAMEARFVPALREALGEAAFEAARTAGAALPTDEAIALALQPASDVSEGAVIP